MSVFGVIDFGFSREQDTSKTVIRKRSYFSKIARLHKGLFKAHTSFGYATFCALVIGFGSVLTVATDIVWLLGDMSIQVHPHHYYVLFGLVTGELVMIGSFIWLYKAISSYLIKKRNKQRKAAKRNFLTAHTPTHCDVNPKRQINKAYLKLVPDLPEE